MRAICIENMYSRKGSTIISEPAFLSGKTYELTSDTQVGTMELPGDYKLVNERGVVTILSKGMFDRHFFLDDYSNDWVMD